METRRQRLSQRREAAERSATLGSQAEVRQDRTELADLFSPQVADAVAPSPRTSQSAGAGSEGFDAMSTAGDSSQVASTTQLTPVELTRPIDAVHARSRVKRVAVLGALAAVITAGAAYGSLASAHRAPITVVDTGATAPVAVVPASDLGANTSPPGNDHPAPINNTEGAAPTAAAAPPQPRAVTKNDNRTVITNRPKHRAVTPRSDRQAALAEAHARIRAAEHRAHNQRWERYTSPRP
jgi:hypothetical protein